VRLLARERELWRDDPRLMAIRSVAYWVWALGSFAWLCGFGGWVIGHEGPGPGHSLAFFAGTVWAGSFFVHLLNRK
jgi:hypothetical protein